MRLVQHAILVVLPVFVLAQSGFNLTGRVSLRMLNTTYDEKSKIKPDSIPDSAYSKSTLIPGLQQSLNLAFFARTSKLDLTLLGDIRNNDWNQLNELRNVNRLSLNARFGNHEIILGDFFESGSEFFVQSREVRGGQAYFKFDQLWNYDSYLEAKVTGGLIQNAYGIGHRLRDLYRQYENAGQYRRYFSEAMLRLGESNNYHFGLHYLYAKDDNASIKRSLNEPLTNQNAGLSGMIFLWERRIQFFAEGYYSRKDTLSAKGINDHAYKGGVDLRLHNFKITAFYQRLGYDYYTAGYPFLQNDRQGFRLNTAWQTPNVIILFAEGEQYEDNLNDDAARPTTTTRLGEVGFTTKIPKWPELTLKWRFRDDNSNVIRDSLKTEKITRAYDGRLSYGFGRNSLSLSAMFIELDDRSVLPAGQPLGTEQVIASLNFYTRPFSGMFISAGGVYSTLLLTNNQKNKNMYFYESSRWDLIPRLLKLETTVSYINNDAANGGKQDLLSEYSQIGGEVSLEFFFSSYLSLKAMGGTDRRAMRYSTTEALNVIADPNYGPVFFNSFESYNGMKYGLEINWIF